TLINPATAPLQFHPTHQAGYSLPPNMNPYSLQCLVHSRTAIDPISRVVDRCDSTRQLLILGLASALLSLAPAIVAASRHLVGAAQHAYSVLVPVLFHESIDLCFRSEQNRIAFFSRVSSSFKARFSCCRTKMKMSAFTKVEMSGFLGCREREKPRHYTEVIPF